MLVRVAPRCLCTLVGVVDNTQTPSVVASSVTRVNHHVLLVSVIAAMAVLLAALAVLAVVQPGH